jgi:hypothetical protein
MRLSIADGLGAIIAEHNKSALPSRYDSIIQKNPIDFLFSIINAHTQAHLKREIEFFKTYHQADDTDLILADLKKMHDMITTYNDNKTCILRMASGSGFHGITGDWRFKDHSTTINKPDNAALKPKDLERGKSGPRYKSRKLVDTTDFQAMGFLQLRQI